MRIPRLVYFCAALLVAVPARAASSDAGAERLADAAMRDDYIAARFKDADKKLQKALKLCGKKSCSPRVLARIQRDVGVVAIGGLKRKKSGAAAFAKAVELDPQIRLEPEVTTPEIESAWKQAGGEVPEAPKAEEPAEEPIELEPEPAKQPEPEPEPRTKANWVSLSVQQDLLFHGRDDAACFSRTYTCFDGNGEQYAGPIYRGYGNQVAPGAGLATTRVLLGYDRLLLERILIGARFGFAFGGAPTLTTGAKFLPIHAEARGAYFFGEAPFEAPGLRPFVNLGLGIGEVDASVAIDFYASEADRDANVKQTLVGWRKTGKAFVAPGLGTQFGFGSASALSLELRGLLMIGTPGTGLAVNVGYAHGI